MSEPRRLPGTATVRRHPNPDGGTGTWDANSSLNWWDGGANVVWPAPGGTDGDAVFGDTAGTVPSPLAKSPPMISCTLGTTERRDYVRLRVSIP